MFVVALTAIGCGTAVVLTMIDKLFGGNKEKARLEVARQELRHAQELARQQDLRIVDLSRQNDQLQKQVEWHGRLLDTQEQALKRLGSGDRDPAGVR